MQFVVQFEGLLDDPVAFAAAIVQRKFRGYRERYKIPFFELLNEALLRLWEAKQKWDEDESTHFYRHFDPEAKQWVMAERKFTTYAWQRVVWYLGNFIRSVYIRHSGMTTFSEVAERDGEDGDFEEHVISSLLEDPDSAELAEDAKVQSLINLILDVARTNGVQGKKLSNRQVPKYRRILELLALGYSSAETAVELGYEDHKGVGNFLDALREKLQGVPEFMAVYGPLVKNAVRGNSGRGPESSYPMVRRRQNRTLTIEADFAKMATPEIVKKYGVSRATAWRARTSGQKTLRVKVDSMKLEFHHAPGKVIGSDDDNRQVSIQVELDEKIIIKTSWQEKPLNFVVGDEVMVSWLSYKTGSETRVHLYTHPSAVELAGRWNHRLVYQRIHIHTATADLGHKAETVVLEALKRKGLRVERASDFEDEKLGVDLWVLFPIGKEWQWLPLDVTIQISSSLEDAGKAKKSFDRGVISARVFPNQILMENYEEIFQRIKAEITSQVKLAKMKNLVFVSRHVARIRELYWNKKHSIAKTTRLVAKKSTTAKNDEWVLV